MKNNQSEENEVGEVSVEEKIKRLEEIVDQQSKDIDDLFDALEIISMRGTLK